LSLAKALCHKALAEMLRKKAKIKTLINQPLTSAIEFVARHVQFSHCCSAATPFLCISNA
jgi:hypothetical protein